LNVLSSRSSHRRAGKRRRKRRLSGLTVNGETKRAPRLLAFVAGLIVLALSYLKAKDSRLLFRKRKSKRKELPKAQSLSLPARAHTSKAPFFKKFLSASMSSEGVPQPAYPGVHVQDVGERSREDKSSGEKCCEILCGKFLTRLQVSVC
jgi:hypothetical protein